MSGLLSRTRFKVLQVNAGRRPLVLMRELFPLESSEHPVGSGSERTERLDEATVTELERAAAQRLRRDAVDIITGSRERLPGLIVTTKSAR
ncbi:hypothetical protein ACWCQW_51475 [Streptomyces mirabilis]